jgi:hypothetical protein
MHGVPCMEFRLQAAVKRRCGARRLQHIRNVRINRHTQLVGISGFPFPMRPRQAIITSDFLHSPPMSKPDLAKEPLARTQTHDRRLLDYRKKAADAKPIPVWKSFVLTGLVFAFGMLLLCSADGNFPIFAIGVGIVLCGLTLLLFAPFGNEIFGFFKRRNMTEREFDLEWNERNEKRQAIEDRARTTHANGPVGKWDCYSAKWKTYGWGHVDEERLIIFEADGTGKYAGFRREASPQKLEVVFRYNGNGPESLSIQIVDPPEPLEAQTVQFGFESKIAADGEGKLILWLESTNPFSPGFADHWPFWGTFAQADQ